MNYNMEDIQRLAEEVAKLVQASIHQEQIERKEPQTMVEFEFAFREALRQIGAEALGSVSEVVLAVFFVHGFHGNHGKEPLYYGFFRARSVSEIRGVRVPKSL